jgi:hypothetical protein
MVRSGIDPDVQWLSVISRQLGDLNIILAGEVDCVKGTLHQAGLSEVLRLVKVDIRANRTRFLN